MSISEWIHHTADSLVAHNLQIPLFLLLIFFAFAEAALFVGFILPGETALLIGGVLAHAGGYEVGKHLGPRIKENAFGRFVGEKRWKLAQAIFDRYHGGAIFFGRAQALLRALVPALAGMNKVPYRQFIKWNAAGGIVFSTIVVLLGFEFANSLATLEKYLRYWAFFFLAVVAVVIVILKRKLEHLLED
jgi:membrane protein DedA with SNARE-associated domain